MKRFADLADLPEDDRLRLIGEFLQGQPPGTIVGIVVDGPPDGVKAARYRTKIVSRYRVRVIDTVPGPVKGSALIRLAQRGDA